LRFGGAVSAWVRAFPDSPAFFGQLDGVAWPYLEGWVKADYTWGNGANRISFKPYGRWDIRGSRSLVDIREGYYLHVANGWDFLAGINTVRWGVVESRRLVNIINQVDLAWNIDGEELLGQPMVNLNINSPNWGTLSLYGLVGFRERHEPRLEDRLRAPLIAHDAIIRADDAERNINFAARYFNSVPLGSGSVDVAFSYFHGVSREPRYIPTPLFPPFTGMIPIYDLIDQGGAEAVATFGSLQLKFEGIWRWANSEDFGAAVTGFEYTVFNVMGSGMDLGLIGEHLVDNRSIFQPPTIYDHDIFVGMRLSVNDTGSTRFLGGLLVDYENDEKYITGKFATRVAADLLVELEGRYFFPVSSSSSSLFPLPSSSGLTFPLNRDSFLQGRVTKYF
jgi:hypothetical protein